MTGRLTVAIASLLLLCSCGGLTTEERAFINGSDKVMHVLTVYNYYEAKTLHTRSRNFAKDDFSTAEFRMLCENMLATVQSPQQSGVGIAGPQVGILRRIVAVKRYDKPDSPFEVYPNIRIVAKRGEKQFGPEGCLSVPGRREEVQRWQDIDIKYSLITRNADGEVVSVRDTVENVKGFTAVIFQHECDHLDGVLYTDYFDKGTEVTLKVKTTAGIVKGLLLPKDGIKAYLGVPYAEAPVGDLRWKAPQAKTPWEGVREATEFGNDPMQPALFSDMLFCGPTKSEDCLYLNVWTPALWTGESLPVLIYFNGGGLMAGSGSEPRYNGTAIARRGGVVVVTANYREGIFGFFAHPELTEENGTCGNYGFLDQVAAIDWVHENITAFGGDPDRITIAGESAGSFSVSLLMASPLSKDKIAGAILSSGAELLPYGPVTLEAAEKAGEARLKSVGLKSLADARALPSDSLQTLLPPNGMSSVVLDGYFMKEAPDDIFAKGDQADVPVLAGWNSYESDPGASTLVEFRRRIAPHTGKMTDKVLESYGVLTDADVNSEPGFTLAGDLFTGFPTWKLCDYHASTSHSEVYRYRFCRARPHLVDDPDGYVAPGAVHSADIEYAMFNLEENNVFDWQEEDLDVSFTFGSFYVNFIRSGNPNGEGLPLWSPINGRKNAAPVMQIDVCTQETASEKLENAYRTLEKALTGR